MTKILSPRRRKKKQLKSKMNKRHRKKIPTMPAVIAAIWTVRVVMVAKVWEAAWVAVGVVEVAIEMMMMTKKSKKRYLVEMQLSLSSILYLKFLQYSTKHIKTSLLGFYSYQTYYFKKIWILTYGYFNFSFI